MNIIDLPPLKIEMPKDGEGDVILSQYQDGRDDAIAVHPLQVAMLAQRLGLLPRPTDEARTIARLSRQMRLLQERIKHLDEMLTIFAGAGRVELEYEFTYSSATLDIVNEFVIELPVPVVEAAPSAPARVASAPPAPACQLSLPGAQA